MILILIAALVFLIFYFFQHKKKGLANSLADVSIKRDLVEKLRIELQEAEKDLESAKKKQRIAEDRFHKKYKIQ